MSIRLVKRFRMGHGAFVYWSTRPGGDRSVQRSDGVRPFYWWLLLIVLFGSIVLAHLPT